jgi:hypothetical protein
MAKLSVEVEQAFTLSPEQLEALLEREERRIGRELLREIQCLHPSGHRDDCRICQLRQEWDRLPRRAA